MRDGLIGYIDTPRQGNVRPAGVAWCADNGCFSAKWDEAKWWKFLQDNAADVGDCLFAVAPDVVADALATTQLFRKWGARIRALGYPVAYVAQDGLENLRGVTADGSLTFPVPWVDFDVLFIGGSTEWKLGHYAREIAHEAKLRGKRIHVGRINSERRYRYAIGPYPLGLAADTCDGTMLTRGPDVNLPRILAMSRLIHQLDLFTPQETS